MLSLVPTHDGALPKIPVSTAIISRAREMKRPAELNLNDTQGPGGTRCRDLRTWRSGGVRRNARRPVRGARLVSRAGSSSAGRGGPYVDHDQLFSPVRLTSGGDRSPQGKERQGVGVRRATRPVSSFSSGQRVERSAGRAGCRLRDQNEGPTRWGEDPTDSCPSSPIACPARAARTVSRGVPAARQMARSRPSRSASAASRRSSPTVHRCFCYR